VDANGDVELLGLTPTARMPWALVFSPDGEYLLASAFKDATLTAFKIGDKGNLSKVASLKWDKNIFDFVTR
jgi:6-phosphogluconolactonase (cycloisomerase 2 family)